MVDVVEVVLSQPKALHCVLMAAFSEITNTERCGVEFEGEIIPLRILCKGGVDFRRSIDRGGKRESDSLYDDFVFVYHDTGIFLVYVPDFKKTTVSFKEFAAWAKTQTPVFLVHLSQETEMTLSTHPTYWLKCA